MRIFFALKIPTASAGFEPWNLGTKGQHATSRPPKQLPPALILEDSNLIRKTALKKGFSYKKSLPFVNVNWGPNNVRSVLMTWFNKILMMIL